MTREREILKPLSEYRERQCRCHMWWKTVPEVGAWNGKTPFTDGGKVEWWYSKLVGGRLESLPGWHVSDTGEVWLQIRWCTAVQSSESHYGVSCTVNSTQHINGCFRDLVTLLSDNRVTWSPFFLLFMLLYTATTLSWHSHFDDTHSQTCNTNIHTRMKHLKGN